MSVEQMASEMRFDADEMLVLALLQQVMVGRDLIADRDAVLGALKQRFRDELAAAAQEAYWSRPDSLPRWAQAHARAITARVPAHQRAAIEAAAGDGGPCVGGRSRALLVLVELVAYEPWGTSARWVPAARRDALQGVAGYLTALRPEDLRAVTAEFEAVLSALARRVDRGAANVFSETSAEDPDPNAR